MAGKPETRVTRPPLLGRVALVAARMAEKENSYAGGRVPRPETPENPQ
jgi:hypothetical protein